jgi:hypothetical protein
MVGQRTESILARKEVEADIFSVVSLYFIMAA